jgi:uncharacterized protein (TIGR02145 family)
LLITRGSRHYDYNPNNTTTLGIQGICPSGWHLPTDDEWTVLSDYLGGYKIAGAKMKSTSGWYNNGNGTNSSGFTGLPGGLPLQQWVVRQPWRRRQLVVVE